LQVEHNMPSDQENAQQTADADLGGAGHAHGKASAAPPAAVLGRRLLRKIRRKTFGPRDWQRLAAAVADPRTRRALGHLSRITPRLVRQLAELPPFLMRPRVLCLLNRLRLPPERWRALRSTLADPDPQRRAALAALAGKIRTPGDLWDFWQEAIDDPARPFPLPQDVFSSPLLAPLPDAAALRTESRRMSNCLAGMAGDVRAGRTICFRPRSLAPVTAELVAHREAWRVGRILGHANTPLPPEESGPLHLELQRMADHLNQRGPPAVDDLYSPALQEIRAWARARYSEATILSVAQPLSDIRARSAELQRGAFAIFQIRMAVYVQFLALLDGTGFLGEVSSHKYEPFMHARLCEPVVALLERAGFHWPQGQQNFNRRFFAQSHGDMLAIAEITLALLDRIGGLRPGATLTRRGHIPGERAPCLPPPHWKPSDGGLDLEDELTAQGTPAAPG
jgi:hypothetical protein